MSNNNGIVLTILFGLLAVITTTALWNNFGPMTIIQTVAILIVATIGEHFVSGKGYYHYTTMNGVFVGRVPTWIPLMWIVVIQGSFLISLIFSTRTMDAIALSGILCASLDLYILEPLLSRKLGMWRWTSVDDGLFSFIPKRVNRFTAPFGNYLTWLIFPIILNFFLVCLFFI
jgi:uncharacterized membrane protein